MLKNYLILALRQLRKHPLYSGINILGLSFGIAIFLVLWCYIRFETSYDTFHSKADQLYQLNTSLYSLDLHSSTAWDVGPAMKESIPGIRNFARLHWSDGVLTLKNESGDKKSYSEGSLLFADNSVFELFSLQSIAGDLPTALSRPYTIVLSKSLASKFFADPSEAIGKVIEVKGDWLNADLTITAVIEDAQRNSTINYNGFVSIEPLIQSRFYQAERRWDNFSTFLELEDGLALQKVNDALPRFIAGYMSGEKLTYQPEMFLQPFPDIHLSRHDPRQGKDMTNIYLFVTIAIIVLAIAWVNYINLSTARSIERAREVGVKKALGVLRKELVKQFMIESLTVNVISVTVAVLLASLLMPLLNGLAGQQYNLDLTSRNQVLTILCLLIFGTMVSGFYPAIILSSFRTTEVIKGSTVVPGGGFSLRKGLIVFQFTASLSLLICTLAIVQQVDFMKGQDKGVATEQVLVVTGPDEAIGNGPSVDERTLSFKNKLLSLSSVERVSTSGVVPGGSYNHDTHMDIVGKSDEETIPGENTYVIFADMDYAATYGMTIKEGRTWDPQRVTDYGNVLINEATVTAFGLGTNRDAIGQKIVVLRDTLTIMGVVKNFYWESLKVSHHPVVLAAVEVYPRKISILVRNDMEGTIARIRELYAEHFPGNEFDYYFADEFYNRMYASDLRFGAIFGVFAVFAMIVACLGLFGMATFTTHQRSREIGIRKVLGASVSNIMVLLSTQFGKLLIVAIMVSTPISWLAIEGWLEGYPIRISMSLWMFAVPSIALLLILGASVVVQVYRGANVNPARVLRG